MTKRILLGLHSQEIGDMCELHATMQGYEVYRTDNPIDMVRMAREIPFERYIMDLNLGNPGSPDITSGREAWSIVGERVDGINVKFRGISGNDETVKAGEKAGIPSLENTVFASNIRQFFE